MSDLISRKAAIDLLKKWSDGYSSFDVETNWAIKSFEALPSAQQEQQWIPCSERLPEIDKEVLVTDGEICWVCSLFESPDIEDGYHQWEDNYGHWHEFDTWIAWMPLPEPYKGGRMTKELAIRILTGDVLGTSEQTQEAVTMAVKALSLSSAQPELTDYMAIEHLQSTGWMQNHDKEMYEAGLRERLADDSDSYDSLIPSAQPERKKGEWVKMTGMMPPEYIGHYECSECGWHLSHHDKTKENELGFCPHCGAYMRGE